MRGPKHRERVQTPGRGEIDVFKKGMRETLRAEQLAAIKAQFGVAGEVRAIPGCPGYAVSDDGRVFSAYSSGPRPPGDYLERRAKPNRDGHLVVAMYGKACYRHPFVHQLVMLAFVGPCPTGLETRHVDGDPANNRLSNRCYGTRKQNGEDKVRHGRSLKGSRASCAKLNEAAVAVIKALLREGVGQSELGRWFGVSSTAIRSVGIGRTWGHVS
jgi:hypothetical protein